MKNDSLCENAKITFSEFLKKNKKRNTQERNAIVERVYEQKGFFSVDALHKEMQDDNYRVSLGTIYSTISLLQDCNLLIRHQLRGKEVVYEKFTENRSQQQLICVECGKKKDFIDKPIRTTIKKKRLPLFDVTHYSLSVYGVCNKCKRKKNSCSKGNVKKK